MSKILQWLMGLTALGLLALSVRADGPWVHPSAIDHPGRTLICLALGFAFMLLPAAAALRARLRRLVFDSSLSAFRVALFLLGTAAYAVMSHVVFDAIPRLDDAVGSLFQARIFARGAVTLAPPAHPEFFGVFGVLGPTYGVERWCGMYPPGWPALLTLGHWIGRPWLIAPLCGGALAVAVSLLGRALYGDRAGRMAGLFCLLSPFVMILSASHLSHTATALFLCLCAWGVLRLLRTGTWTHGLLAGAAWGAAFLCRPLTALLVGLCIGTMPLVCRRRTLTAWRGVLAALLVAAAAGGTQAAFQKATTGDARTPGHVLGMGRRGKMGFVRLDHARTHTPALGLQHSIGRLAALNRRLHGTPWPSLLLVLLPLLALRTRMTDLWLLLPLIALLCTYATFWYFENYFPARYLFAATPMLFVLTARGYDVVAGALHSRGRIAAATPPALLLAGYLFALTVGTPDYVRGHGDHFGDVETVLPRLLRRHDIHNAVVFMDSVGIVDIRGDTENDFYATGFQRNTLDLDGDIVFARNRREENVKLMDAYPDRDYYFYRYERGSDTARLYRLVRTAELFETIPLETPDRP